MSRHPTEIQRKILLEWLQKKPCSTIEARHELDIIAPAARVHELRHEHGYNIQTIRTTALNPGGCYHTVAKYVLLPGKYEGDIRNG